MELIVKKLLHCLIIRLRADAHIQIEKDNSKDNSKDN